MVKVFGPLASAEASGTIGDAATFSSWKGRAYAKRKSIPFNPQTAMQVSVRAMMGFLSAAWTNLTVPQQASWTVSAQQAAIPPYNQFISANLSRFREFAAPSKATPAAETGTQAELDAWSATGAAARATLNGLWYGLNDGWGLMIFRSLDSGFVTSRSNCIAVIPHTILDGNFYVDQGLAPATYYYKFRPFTAAGKLGAASDQQTAIVT